ncbi:MAG: membrane protein insertase YidC [Gammaproteobacteria bacterium]|nr:membrane protein insertase YidC [Gammaproteobacteria bacterium]
MPPQGAPAASTQQVVAKSDTLIIAFDGVGGDIRQVVLRKHFARGEATQPFTLMQEKVGHYFIAQTGLLGAGLPNHTSRWAPANTDIDLGNQEKVDVVFTNTETPGITVNKVYTLTRGSYVVDVRYDIKNTTDAVIQPKAYFSFYAMLIRPKARAPGVIRLLELRHLPVLRFIPSLKNFKKSVFQILRKTKRTT